MFAGKKIVFTAGTWDLFHVGHLRMIERAKEHGDVLIVGVSTDELVESYKDKRPINSYEERFAVVNALSCISFVVEQIQLIDVAQMKQLCIDVLVLGKDWEHSDLPGIEWMRTNKNVVFLPRTEGISTSIIKHKLRSEQ